MTDEVGSKMEQMSDFRKLVLTSIVSALSLVVGLFWNDAIRATIDEIVPKGDTLFYKYLAAFIVTILIVIIVYVLMHTHKAADQKISELQKQIAEDRKRWLEELERRKKHRSA